MLLLFIFLSWMLPVASLTAQVVVDENTLTSGSYTVLSDGQVTIELTGADGGNGSTTTGGEGATVTATFEVSAGDIIRFVVGEAGVTHNGSSAGGGGSSGVYINDTLVLVAGGGGGGDNSTSAVGLGGTDSINGSAGTGTGPGLGGLNGQGGQGTQTTVAAGGGGGVFSAGGSGDGTGGATADNTTSDPSVLLAIAAAGTGNGTGSAGGAGFTGGGGADSNYSGGGGGYSGGGGAGGNGSAGGGGSFVQATALSSVINAGGDGTGSESDGSIRITFADTNPPQAPASLSGTIVTPGSALLSFPDVNETGSGVASYSLKRSLTNGTGYTEIASITDDESATYQFTDTGLSDFVSYFYVVSSIDNAGNESTLSNQVEIQIINSQPQPPAVAQARAVQAGVIEVRFEDVNSSSGIVSYSVARSENQGGPYSTVATITDTDQAEYVFSDLNTTDGQRYYYAINSLDNNGNTSEASEEVTAVADALSPQIQSIVVNATEVLVDHNETLNTQSVPSVSDYSVAVNGQNISITSVNISGSRVIIRLPQPVNAGDNLQISYSPGINPVQDKAGNATALFSNLSGINTTFSSSSFGPDPCPISNNNEVAWACFSGVNGGTSMEAALGVFVVGTVNALAGSQTAFSPNALQQWASGAFSGDEYNGPQLNPSGLNGDATSFDIVFEDDIPSRSVILALNRLRPESGSTTYTLQAFDDLNTPITVNDWVTGQGSDGGNCINPVDLIYSNANTTIEFRPQSSSLQGCSASSNPVWFRISDNNVKRIQIRKVSSLPDNIHFGLGFLADFGDAPDVYGTLYSGTGAPSAIHLVSAAGNTVFLGNSVDADGNGFDTINADGDDLETASVQGGDDENGITVLPPLNSGMEEYSMTLVCSQGAAVKGWIDFDLSGSFDGDEAAGGVCSPNGSVNLLWNNLSGITEGQSYARFRISSDASQISTPVGLATDGEVEDYTVTITEPPLPDLTISVSSSNSSPNESDIVELTTTVTNPGLFAATGVQVTGSVPAGLTFISVSTTQGSYNPSTGVWNIGNLASGDTSTVSMVIEAQVATGTLGQSLNYSSAITALNETDPDLSDNSDETGLTVVPQTTDIAVSSVASNNSPVEGEVIDITINVANNGPRLATGLSILNQLPDGLVFVDSTTTTGIFNPQTGLWNIGTLGNGNSASLVITLQVEDETIGSTIVNTSAVQNLDQTDSNVNNDVFSVTLSVTEPSVNLSCGLPFLQFQNPSLVSGSALNVGARYRFPNVLNGVYADVEILTISNATILDIDDDNNPGVASALEFSPFIENSNGGSAYVDFRISFFDAATGQPRFLSFSATTSDVDGTGDLRDFVGYQNLNSFVVENTTQLTAGSEGIYTTFISSNFTNTTPTNSNFTNYKVYATYTNEPSFRIRAGIDATNTTGGRAISVNFDPCEINTFSNPVSEIINDVAVTKSVDVNSVNTGEQVTYTVQVQNKRSSAASGIRVLDQLPAGLSFVTATASQGTYDSGTGIWDIGSLTGLQLADLQLTAQVNSGTEGDLITNTASLNDITGIDGVSGNNTSAADIFVIDPGSGLTCTDPPLFSFLNFQLEQGVLNQVNSVYRFSNVGPGIDALVRVIDINNAVLDDVDVDNIAGQAEPSNFSPLFTKTAGSANGYIDWEIRLVQAGTNNPVRQDFAVTGVDIDGNDVGSGNTIRDYYGFAENQSNIIQAGGNLNETVQGDFQVFESSTTTDGNGALDIDHMVYIQYRFTTIFRLRTGSFATNGYAAQRLVAFNFRQCLNQEFSNPVVSTRNADLGIQKTANEQNPLPGQNLTFDINVTNNGPEEATEIFINEAIPAGLTLVEANASSGVYNALTNTWQIQQLPNGANATLTLAVTADQNQTADSLVNTAFIEGFNQFDPDITNDTSSVVIRIGKEIKGTVFEDITGNGIEDDNNINDAAGDQRAMQNVAVHLFRDGGDQLPDGTDETYLQTTTTDNQGRYSFQIGTDGAYWVVVGSRTGSLSNGTSWAEQVYAPEGGFCEDGNGNSAMLNADGHCFGGREANRSDQIPETPDASDIALAEHVAFKTVNGATIGNINFGFSFNVVTNLRDGDDDNNALRSIQGTIRQFIQNANVLSGANSMRFVPSVPANRNAGGDTWWNITLSSSLPAITDALTTVNGTAFDRTAPAQIRNTNPGTVGVGGATGTDNIPLEPINRPELEIDGNGLSEVNTISTSSSATIQNIGLFNATDLIRITSGSSILIDQTVLGALADGNDPASQRGGSAVSFTGGASVSALLQQNYIRFLNQSGVRSENPSASVTLFKNEITENSISDPAGNGIQGSGTWNIQSNRINANGSQGSNPVTGGSGIRLTSEAGSSSGNLIRNNTLTGNSVNGIAFSGSFTGSLIEKNVIESNGSNYSGSSTPEGSGIRLSNPSGMALQGIRISRNRFSSNYGLAIDLIRSNGNQADGVNVNDGATESASVTPNAGIDYPVFTLATLEAGELRVEGYVGTAGSILAGTYTIEIYKALDDGDSDALVETGNALIRPHGEGNGFIGTLTTTSDGRFNTSLPLNGSTSLAFNDRITALTISSSGNTSEFSANQRIVPAGVTISGTVYDDVNHNTIRDGDENGLQGVTIVLFDRNQNNCRSVQTDSDGNYQFSNILNGTYDLIESAGQSIPTPDLCTPPENDPDGFISTTPNLRTVVVNNLPAIQDFGDYQGIRIDGTVFNDNGESDGTANDGTQNGGEAGTGSSQIQALLNGSTVVDVAVSAENGRYSLYIQSSVAPVGSQITIQEVNAIQVISTGGSSGNTGGAYSLNDDRTVFSISAVQVFEGVDFANVPVNQFLTDGQQNSLPGAVSVFTHTYIASTAGTVRFEVNSTSNPNPPQWPVVLYNDLNCDLGIDSGEPILQTVDEIPVTAGQNLCLLLRVNIPLGLNDGANNTSVITATFTYANTTPSLESVLTRTDLVTVSTTEAGLVLIKAVDKQQALPGESLQYTISYENLGDEPISSIEIIDQTPGFTTYQSAACGTLPAGVTNCTIDAPVTGESGTIKWIFSGTLQPGQSGSVTYIVVIDN